MKIGHVPVVEFGHIDFLSALLVAVHLHVILGWRLSNGCTSWFATPGEGEPKINYNLARTMIASLAARPVNSKNSLDLQL